MSQVSQTMRFLSDEIALKMLMAMRDGARPTDFAFLTRKQFYLRLNAGRKLGLIIKCRDKYILSTYGRVVIEHFDAINHFVTINWAFKSIDRMPDKESRERLISELFKEDPKIRELLLRPTRL